MLMMTISKPFYGCKIRYRIVLYILNITLHLNHNIDSCTAVSWLIGGGYCGILLNLVSRMVFKSESTPQTAIWAQPWSPNVRKGIKNDFRRRKRGILHATHGRRYSGHLIHYSKTTPILPFLKNKKENPYQTFTPKPIIVRYHNENIVLRQVSNIRPFWVNKFWRKRDKCNETNIYPVRYCTMTYLDTKMSDVHV